MSRSNRRGANGGEGGGSHLADDRQGGFVGAAGLLVPGGGGKMGSDMQFVAEGSVSCTPDGPGALPAGWSIDRVAVWWFWGL